MHPCIRRLRRPTRPCYALSPMLDTDPIVAVTFDVGQTLTSLDTTMLAIRVRAMGVEIDEGSIAGALDRAWQDYNAAVKSAPASGTWKTFMSSLLAHAGARTDALGEVVERLWLEQPQRNLWRRPVPGMIDVVDALNAWGVPVGVVSNSEGRLAELLQELGWRDKFRVVADSGKLGIEKPDVRIFEYACRALGVPLHRTVHIGDSLAADVEGAMAAGMRAIWFRGTISDMPQDRVRCCATAAEVLNVLRQWGALPARVG